MIMKLLNSKTYKLLKSVKNICTASYELPSVGQNLKHYFGQSKPFEGPTFIYLFKIDIVHKSTQKYKRKKQNSKF